MEYVISAEIERLHAALESLCDVSGQFASLAAQIKDRFRKGTIPRTEDYQQPGTPWGDLIARFCPIVDGFWVAWDETHDALDGLPGDVAARLDRLDQVAWRERLRRSLDDLARDYRFSRPADVGGARKPIDVASVVVSIRRCPLPEWTPLLQRLRDAERDLYALRERPPKHVGMDKGERASAEQSVGSGAAAGDLLTTDELARLAGVVVETAGDLWKVLAEGREPAVAVSAISLPPPSKANIVETSFPKPADQAKWDALERALTMITAEGGDKAAAMERLIARVALAQNADRRKIINMPLVDFVAVASAGLTTATLRHTPRRKTPKNQPADTVAPQPPQSVTASAAIPPDDGYMGPGDLAACFGVDAENLRKRLERWRATTQDGWKETDSRRRNEPRFLYQVKAVRPIIDAMPATHGSGETSSERPTE